MLGSKAFAAARPIARANALVSAYFASADNPALVNSRVSQEWAGLDAGLKADRKAGRTSDGNVLAAYKGIASDLVLKVHFLQILPGAHSARFYRQLLNNERVHELPTVRALKGRIGDMDTHRCYARVFNRVSRGIRGVGLVTQEMSSAIYTHWSIVPLQDNRVDQAALTPALSDILGVPKQPFDLPENDPSQLVIATLYTISGNGDYGWDKGSTLAEDVYTNLHQEAKEKGYKLLITTLSPIRDFYDTEPEIYKRLADMNFKPDEQEQNVLRRDVLNYLLKEKDPVMNFHLGNGAYIGDIKFNPDNSKDPIMVNYVYPSAAEKRIANQALYRETNKLKRPIAAHLYEEAAAHSHLLLDAMRPLTDGDTSISFDSSDARVVRPASSEGEIASAAPANEL